MANETEKQGIEITSKGYIKENKACSLRGFRRQSGKAPTFECGNCKCKRYSPCGCLKKAPGA